MSNGNDQQSGTITADDVRRWKEERARLEARIAQIVRKIDAAELLFPGIGSVDQMPPATHRPTSRGGSMGDAVIAAIREAGAPLAPPEIRRRLENAGFEEKLGRNPNYLYTVIFRLFRRGELVREGDRYRLPDVESPQEVSGGDDHPREFTLN